MQSYEYARRKGVMKISWGYFYKLSMRLAEQLEAYNPEMVLGIARGGLFPATAVACMLRRELYPIRLTRRLNDEVVYEKPVWKCPVPSSVKGASVAVIDEISDSGETLAMASDEVRKAGARVVITASLVSHSWANPTPTISADISDALIIFPWDQKVFIDGMWVPHPEIVTAMAAQDDPKSTGISDN